MKNKWRMAALPIRHPAEANPLRILHDAVVATGAVGDGRALPLLILDTSERPDLHALILAHAEGAVGDVKVSWGRLPNKSIKAVALTLEFERPVTSTAIIGFDIATQWILVDQILRTNGFYFQPGVEGDRLKTTWESPRILIEVPTLEFDEEWERILLQALAKQLKSRGYSRREAKRLAGESIQRTREAMGFRFRPGGMNVRGDG